MSMIGPIQSRCHVGSMKVGTNKKLSYRRETARCFVGPYY